MTGEEVNNEVPPTKEEPNQLFSGGSGTKDDPYLISTPMDIDDIRDYASSHFKQINDVDMSGFELNSIGDMDDNYIEFSGFYDGKYFSISNLNSSLGCLFYVIGKTAEVKRLRLVNSINSALVRTIKGNVHLSSVEGKASYFNTRGGFCEQVIEGGEVSRCFITDGVFMEGGFARKVENATIKDCYVRKGIQFKSGNSSGFIMRIDEGGRIENCYCDDIAIDDITFNASGFALYNYGTVKESYCSNVLISKERAADISGFVDRCYGLSRVSDGACLNVSIELGEVYNISGFSNRVDTDSVVDNCYVDILISAGIVNGINDPFIGRGTGTRHSMNAKWGVSSVIFNGKPYLKRFWEGTDDPNNPWAVDPNINDGMPYLKQVIDPEKKELQASILTDVARSANPYIYFEVPSLDDLETTNVTEKEDGSTTSTDNPIRVDFRISSYSYNPPPPPEEEDSSGGILDPIVPTEPIPEGIQEEYLKLQAQFSSADSFARRFEYKKRDGGRWESMRSRNFGSGGVPYDNLKDLQGCVFRVKLPIPPELSFVTKLDVSVIRKKEGVE